MQLEFRRYRSSNYQEYLGLFDLNCPSFFEKYDAIEIDSIKNGLVLGIHKINMEIYLKANNLPVTA